MYRFPAYTKIVAPGTAVPPAPPRRRLANNPPRSPEQPRAVPSLGASPRAVLYCESRPRTAVPLQRLRQLERPGVVLRDRTTWRPGQRARHVPRAVPATPSGGTLELPGSCPGHCQRGADGTFASAQSPFIRAPPRARRTSVSGTSASAGEPGPAPARSRGASGGGERCTEPPMPPKRRARLERCRRGRHAILALTSSARSTSGSHPGHGGTEVGSATWAVRSRATSAGFVDSTESPPASGRRFPRPGLPSDSSATRQPRKAVGLLIEVPPPVVLQCARQRLTSDRGPASPERQRPARFPSPYPLHDNKRPEQTEPRVDRRADTRLRSYACGARQGGLAGHDASRPARAQPPHRQRVCPHLPRARRRRPPIDLIRAPRSSAAIRSSLSAAMARHRHSNACA